MREEDWKNLVMEYLNNWGIGPSWTTFEFHWPDNGPIDKGYYRMGHEGPVIKPDDDADEPFIVA